MTAARSYYTVCPRNCGSKCILKVYVENGVITRMGSDDGVPDDPAQPQLRSCLRGWSYRERIYHPERLRYPLKRVGRRGEGRFARISWDEALETYAAMLREVRDTFGPDAIYSMDGSGTIGLTLHNTWRQLGPRFLRLFGGCTEQSLSYSSGATTVGMPYTLGAGQNCSAPNFLHSKLLLLWGWNPAEGGTGTNTNYFLSQAKAAGCRMYVVDPRYSDSAALYADVWVPIKPGTDVALMSAMAWVIIDEGLQDQAFLDRFTLGWEEWFAYIRGAADGIPKTPEWAGAICGVEPDLIRQMAREYACVKPGALVMGLGPQRSAFGEQVARCGPALAALTGNIGVPGGYPGLMNWMLAFPPDGVGDFPMPPNPVGTRVPCNQWPDLFLKGRSGGYPADIQMAVATGANYLNQGGNLHKGADALCKLKYFVVHEQFMTPTARYADLLLPANTIFERMDIGHANGAVVFMPKLIESVGESRSDWEIFRDLAGRLGFGDAFTGGKTEEEWLKELAAASPLLPDWESFKAQQIIRLDMREPIVGYREQVEQGTPFATPSGRVEISSPRLKAAGHPGMPAVPQYLAGWESAADPLLSGRYPLQLIAPHSKKRVHSTFHNSPWLREVEEHALWMHPVDAGARRIKTGDRVAVFNDRGRVQVKVRVTERVRPGVVALPQGVWYDPERPGEPGSVDRAGSANVLTSDTPTPFAGATAQHTCLVEVSVRR